MLNLRIFSLYILIKFSNHNINIITFTQNTLLGLKFPPIQLFQIMASPIVKVTFMVVLVLMVNFGPLAEAVIPCGKLQFIVAPCIGYLRGPGGAVPAPCCNGVRSIMNQSKTTPDRQGVCRCLKSTVLGLPGLNIQSLAALPGKCGVNLPYKVSPTINCNT